MICVAVCPPHAIRAVPERARLQEERRHERAQLLTGNGAAAWGARLAEVDYVPAFPITPQTEIIETLAALVRARRDGRAGW